MFGGHHSTTLTISTFRRSEDTLSKARRTREHFANSPNFDNVYADGNNHG